MDINTNEMKLYISKRISLLSAALMYLLALLYLVLSLHPDNIDKFSFEEALIIIIALLFLGTFLTRMGLKNNPAIVIDKNGVSDFRWWNKKKVKWEDID